MMIPGFGRFLADSAAGDIDSASAREPPERDQLFAEALRRLRGKGRGRGGETPAALTLAVPAGPPIG